MRTSLEEERRALLEQIEASRHVYRRMLSGETADPRATATHGMGARRPKPSSGRQIGQWMSDHPLQVAAGVALLVWLTPGLIRRFRSRRANPATSPAPGPRAGTAKAMATALILLLRNPRRLQTTASVLSTAWQWLRRRMFTPTPIPGRKPHA